MAFRSHPFLVLLIDFPVLCQDVLLEGLPYDVSFFTRLTVYVLVYQRCFWVDVVAQISLDDNPHLYSIIPFFARNPISLTQFN